MRGPGIYILYSFAAANKALALYQLGNKEEAIR
jgi:hypothetical protein